MKLIYNCLSVSIVLLLALLPVVSCSDEYEYKTDYSFYKDAKLKVELLDGNGVLNLKLANGTHQITVGVTPENIMIDIAAYIYQVSDESIAEVDQKGILTMKSVGETELTVKFRGNQEIATSCKVKITRDPVHVSDVVVPATVQVQEEKTVNLQELITVLPGNADNPALLYESMNEEVAIVDENGIVTGKKAGFVNITVTSIDNPEISKQLQVEVVAEVKVTDIELNAANKLSDKEVVVGQVFDLGKVITVLPVTASNSGLVYTLVEGVGVVSLDENGVVTTLTAGTAQIKISAADGGGAETVLTFKVSSTLVWFERALWTVETSAFYEDTGLNYVKDSGGLGTPEALIDGKTNTFLSIRKPEWLKTPGSNKEIYFIIDLGAETEFNTFKFRHRQLNNLLCAYQISISGSNDNQNFEPIVESFDTPYESPYEFTGDFETVKYRYVKVKALDWKKTTVGGSGSSVQISEFNVGKK